MRALANIFTTYEFAPNEAIQASILPSLNQAFIQNIIAQCATEKVNMVFDPANSQQFIQREAELQGQIRILQYLLDESHTAQKLVADVTSTDSNS